MRVAYFGTPADAVPPLQALIAAGHEVVLVVTQPDKRRSRGSGTDPSPVKVAALAVGLPVATPAKAREVIDELHASGAEIGIVVAFGQLLPIPLLEAVPYGFVNLHFSLLPRWRGAAPVERAILAGDHETGVDLMRVEAGLDTGPIFAEVRVPIAPTDTAGDLRERLVAVGAELLVQHLPNIRAATPRPQEGEPTYAEKLTVDEFRIDSARSADELERVVRAGNPRPGAWMVVNGHRVKVWRARVDDAREAPIGTVDADARLTTANGTLVLDEVQAEGKRAMAGPEWRRGVHGDARLDAIGRS